MVAILDVGRDERFQFLEPVVEPAAKIVHKSAGTAYNRSHFPWSLVCFEAHTEASKLFWILVNGSLDVSHFGLA